MSDTDRVLDHIDDVLAGHGAIGPDLEVGPDAMQWAPEAPGDQPTEVDGSGYTRGGIAATADPAERIDPVYVEVTEWVSEYVLDENRIGITDVIRDKVESLARCLYVEPVASGARVVPEGSDPFPLAARGYERAAAYELLGVHCRLVQGFALARFEPFWYPPDGDWYGWDLRTGQRSFFVEAFLAGQPTPAPWDVGIQPRRLTDPVRDLQTWVGAAIERQYVTRFCEHSFPLRAHWEDLMRPLKYRRDAQAAGRALWTTPEILPESIRDRDASAFVGRLADTHLIPAPVLDEIRRLRLV